MRSIFRNTLGNLRSSIVKTGDRVSNAVKVPVNAVTKHSLDAATTVGSLFKIAKWSLILTSTGILFFGIGYVLNSSLVLKMHEERCRRRTHRGNRMK